MKKNYLLLALLLVAALAPWGFRRIHAQNAAGAGVGVVPIQMATPFYSQTPISATAAVNTQTTLSIPAPAGGLYNYVCSLAYEVGASAGGPNAITNVVSTSSNFNSFAVKVSSANAVNTDSGVLWVIGPTTPAQGCVKSAAPGTATTFTSPSGLTTATWTWYATYYQAP